MSAVLRPPDGAWWTPHTRVSSPRRVLGRFRMPAPEEMSCQELVELVTDYLEGALDAETHERFEAHLALCDGCTAYLEQMRATVRVVGAVPDDALSPEMRDRLLEVFRGWRSAGPDRRV